LTSASVSESSRRSAPLSAPSTNCVEYSAAIGPNSGSPLRHCYIRRMVSRSPRAGRPMRLLL
jgi:hypothetical protein